MRNSLYHNNIYILLWHNEFGSVFILGLATLFFGAVSMDIRYCLQNKCDSIKLSLTRNEGLCPSSGV